MKSILVLLSLFAATASAQTKTERIIMVSGDCLRSLTPDRASVTLVAQALENNPGAATQKSVELYNKIRERVKKMNLKNLELETTESGVHEENDWNNGTRKSRGYRSRMGLRVITSESAKLGDVIALAAELKVQEVSGLQSFVSAETRKAERENCLEEAFRNAQMKAEKVAKAAGQKLGPVLQVREDTVSAPPPEPPRPMMAMKQDMAEAASLSAPVVESGVTKISVGIQAVFEIR